MMLFAGPALSCDAQPPIDHRLADDASQPPCDLQGGAVIDARALKALSR
jgi:hypothetical protein